MVSLKTYTDSTVSEDSETMQLTCKLATQLNQDFVSRNDMLTVDCVQPYVANIPVEPFLQADITVLDLAPEMAYIDETNINVYVYAEPVYNLTSLACMLHDVKIPASYFINE